MKRVALALAISAFLLVSGALAANQKPSADEIAIRKGIETVRVQAYNNADTHAMASFWSSEGEYVSPSGEEEAKGPEKIQEALAAFFAKNKGVRLKTTVSHVEILSPDRATATGIAVYESPQESPEKAGFIATLHKEKGKWKLMRVEEDESASPSEAESHLKELSWLIGEWIDRDENASVDTVFQWTKNFSFITGSFTVAVKDRVDLEGTEVIGWDPVDKKLRSWIFDSSGGFGEGTWSHEGNRWVVKTRSVLRSGKKASSINIYTPVNSDTFTWQSVGREVGGELLPNIGEVTVVRKQAEKK